MSKMGDETGSGNVFRDIGVPNAEEHLVKAQLVFKIDTIMKDRGLKQVEAAELLGIRQPDISKMLRGEFRQFSVERCCVFSWRLIRMWRSSSGHTAAGPTRRRCMCPESAAGGA